MLKSLKVSNFKLFQGPVCIDFSSTGNYEFHSEAIKHGIVKTSIMYGKNASGKTSLALAIFDIVSNLTDNFMNASNYDFYQNAFVHKPAEFEFSFIFDESELIYSYKKTDISTILSETLIINNRTVITYDKTQKDINLLIDLKGAENLNVDLKALQISALKLVRNNCVLDDNKENEAFIDLCNFVNKMLLFWSLDTRDFIGYYPISNINIVDRIIKNGHFEDLKQFFKEAGFTDELEHSNRSGNNELYIKYNNTLVNFVKVASTGMRSLLLVYFWLENMKKKEKCPSFVCLDEFDAFYHFELSKFVIKKLKESNCQVLLTTHNTSLFSNDLLRPDCYFICNKDKIVNAYNATDKELREGHNLEKLYRGGIFGL